MSVLDRHYLQRSVWISRLRPFAKSRGYPDPIVARAASVLAMNGEDELLAMSRAELLRLPQVGESTADFLLAFLNERANS
jgi:hypothetical protein